MRDGMQENGSIDAAAERLAVLLTSGGQGLHDRSGSELVFESSLDLRQLERVPAPADVWAVDGGQALVADAKCLQLYVTRAGRVRWRGGGTEVEEAEPLRAHLLGLGEDRRTRARLDWPVAPDAPVDINLLRDWGEWSAVARCVAECEAGGMVLIDGDLQPDWRVPSWWLAELMAGAAAAGVVLVGITKHTSLAWGGAPLLGVLERMAAERWPDERACWWAPIGRTRPDVDPGMAVTVARLDPEARYSFRVDVPGDADPAPVLGALSALCDDAAFPGYPYPLSVADRVAACPGWVRDEVWDRMDDVFDAAGVPLEVRERAFADRHRLMERA